MLTAQENAKSKQKIRTPSYKTPRQIFYLGARCPPYHQAALQLKLRPHLVTSCERTAEQSVRHT